MRHAQQADRRGRRLFGATDSRVGDSAAEGGHTTPIMRGQTALITGPARGIGAELARRLARRGMRLALVGLEPEKLAALANELGDDHVWLECDVTDQASLDAAVKLSVDAL